MENLEAEKRTGEGGEERGRGRGGGGEEERRGMEGGRLKVKGERKREG